MSIGNGDDSSIIVDTSLMAKLTGDIKLRKASSNTSMIWLQMSTDGTGAQRGFHLEMQQIDDVKGISMDPSIDPIQ